MTLTKSQIKIAVMNDVGNRLDDMRESAMGQQQQSHGARAAAARISANIKKLIDVVQQDFDKGEIKKVIEEGELQVLKLIKTYVSRAANACEASSDYFESLAKNAAGKVEAMEQAVKMVQKIRDAEQKKMDAILAAVDSGAAQVDGGDVMMMDQSQLRPVGARPAKTIKQQRLAEAAAQRAAPGNGGPSELVSKPTKRRTRPSKKKAAVKDTGGAGGPN